MVKFCVGVFANIWCPVIFGIVNTPIHSKRHVIDIASAIMYPGTTSAKQDIVRDIGAALTIASVT